MTVQDNKSRTEPQIRRSWRDHLVVPVLIGGGLLTLTWNVVLLVAALRWMSSVAGAGGGG